jgi:hypothetical protein
VKFFGRKFFGGKFFGRKFFGRKFFGGKTNLMEQPVLDTQTRKQLSKAATAVQLTPVLKKQKHI